MSGYQEKSNDKYETAVFLICENKKEYTSTIINSFYYSTFLRICHLLLKIKVKEYDFGVSSFAKDANDDQSNTSGGYHVWFANISMSYFSDYYIDSMDDYFNYEEYLNSLERFRNERVDADYGNKIVYSFENARTCYFKLDKILNEIDKGKKSL